MWQQFKAWAAHPFSVDMTAMEWFLFVGLLIVIVALWNIILFHITNALRTAT
jgi:hypothetical protein